MQIHIHSSHAVNYYPIVSINTYKLVTNSMAEDNHHTQQDLLLNFNAKGLLPHTGENIQGFQPISKGH